MANIQSLSPTSLLNPGPCCKCYKRSPLATTTTIIETRGVLKADARHIEAKQKAQTKLRLETTGLADTLSNSSVLSEVASMAIDFCTSLLTKVHLLEGKAHFDTAVSVVDGRFTDVCCSCLARRWFQQKKHDYFASYLIIEAAGVSCPRLRRG